MYYDPREIVPHRSFCTSLPQPIRTEQHYTYIPFDEITKTLFANDKYPHNTLCWVLKSKGSNTKSKRNAGDEKKTDDICENMTNNGRCVDGSKIGTNTNNGHNSKKELFMRARVVIDDDGDDKPSNGRIKVKYPKGSTYRVRESNLIPVIEKDAIKQNIVLVTSETCDYRRAAAVHTCVDDSFLEIGCDFGICTDRVRRVVTDVPGVPRWGKCGEDGAEVATTTTTTAAADDDGKAVVLGIDKSVESIDIANGRYPETLFSVEDALTKSGIRQLVNLCAEKLRHGRPTVVAVDINGNRELPAVLDCLRNLMTDPLSESLSSWECPRLIVVKSRTLYKELKMKTPF